MGEFLLVAVWPALVALTVVLFNVPVKEIMDGKNGFNESYFSPMSYGMIFLYFVFVLIGLSFQYESINIMKLLCLIIQLIILFIIYTILYKSFRKKFEKTFMCSTDYDSKKNDVYLFFAILLVAISAFIMFSNDYVSSNLESLISQNSSKNINTFSENSTALSLDSTTLSIDIDTLSSDSTTQSENMDTFEKTLFFFGIFSIYALTMLSAGYLYNYGKLFNFHKHLLILSDEGSEALKLIKDNLKSSGSIGNLQSESSRNSVVTIKVESGGELVVCCVELKPDRESVTSIKSKSGRELAVLHIKPEPSREVKTPKEVIEAYIFMETDEFIVIKINGEKLPSIKMNKKYILNKTEILHKQNNPDEKNS